MEECSSLDVMLYSYPYFRCSSLNSIWKETRIGVDDAVWQGNVDWVVSDIRRKAANEGSTGGRIYLLTLPPWRVSRC